MAAADDLSGLGLPVALPDPGGVGAVDEAKLADPADRDLDQLVPALPDDRLFRDDVGDVVPDRLADLLAVAKAIPRAAVAPLRLGVPKRAEYGPGSSRNSGLPEGVGGVL